MAYDNKVRDKAFRLFRKHGSLYQVAKELDINENTIRHWHRREGWDAKLKIIREKVMQREMERAEREEEKDLNRQKQILEQYAQDDIDNLEILKAFKLVCQERDASTLELKSLKEATDVMSNVIKLERLIRGDATDYLAVTFPDKYRETTERMLKEIAALRGDDE
jgi:uncharacterized protein YjcR